MRKLNGILACIAMLLIVGKTAAQIPEPRENKTRTPRGSGHALYALRSIIASPSIASEDPRGIPSPAPSRQMLSTTGTTRTSTVFLVTTTADTGAGSLRRAIEDANASAGADVIQFQIPGGGLQIITPQSPLPFLTDPVTIDGSTAAGYFSQPMIQLDGSQAGVSHGLQVDAAGCSIKALSITRFTFSGIALTTPSNQVDGCYIGVEPNGSAPGGNGLDGISIISANNRIGALSAATNVISGNARNGIRILGPLATGNRVQNSYIGTNAAGLAAIPNVHSGIYIVNSAQDTIGGPGISSVNVISGNGEDGIMITGAMAHDIVIQGNRIGTTILGNASLPNGLHGIDVSHEAGIVGTPSNILIGGSLPDEGNLISGNRGVGVAFFFDSTGGSGNIVAGNLIGTSGSGKTAIPNYIGIYVTRSDPRTSFPGVRIGGPDSDSGNVISGNTFSGVLLNGRGAGNNVIQGNYIGTTREGLTGIAPLGNGDAGIRIDSASFNLIGDAHPLKGNTIGSNQMSGIAVIGDSSRGNRILRNSIGTNFSESINLGNLGGGIYIEGSETRVGGTGAENVIASNKGSGIRVWHGIKNNLRFNSIYGNETLGIDLDSTGIAVNDSLDLDVGGNFLQNFPILDSASLGASQTIVHGRFEGKPLSQVTIDLYSVDTRNQSRFGEGKTFLGEQTFTTNDSGRYSFTALLNSAVRDDQFITAMATDQDGNSSEFTRALFFKDSDGDGLYDLWETQGEGIDINADGRIDVDLWGRGARPDHKDIFVEIHRMWSVDFSLTAQNMVKAAFDSVPFYLVHNPDLKDGIKLHLDFDPADSLLVNEVWSANPWAEFFSAKRSVVGWGLPGERSHPNAKNLLAAKRLAYRYCIFGVAFDTPSPSGLAELRGNDFLVTLARMTPRGGTNDQQAGTFMHELGHTLGLLHGGGDEKQYKPNYISVMNYAWQYPGATINDPGVNLSWRLDYSRAENPRLIEWFLNEKDGMNPVLGSTPGPVVFPFNGPGNFKLTGVMWPGVGVDWDDDGDIWGGSILQTIDINYLDSTDVQPSPGDTLDGYADWPNLKYNFRQSSMFSDPGVVPPGTPIPSQGPLIKEMTTELFDRLQALPPYGFMPPDRAPYFGPTDTTAVGGNRGMLRIILGTPAPPAGQTFNIRSSAPDILSVPATVALYGGMQSNSFEFATSGVEHDTTVFVYFTGIAIFVRATITVRPASLLSLNARGDSGCVITEQGGFRKRYVAGATIFFEAMLDGEAPASGGSMQISSSRPGLISPAPAVNIAGFGLNGLFSVKSVSTVGTPEEVVLTATYRGVSQKDTVILMPAPVYTFTDISQPGSTGYNYQAINNAGDVLIDGVTLYKNGSYMRLDTLPGFQLQGVTGMNDIGWFCGTVWDATMNRNRPAYWKPNVTITLPTPDASHPTGEVSAINNQGKMIGHAVALTFPYDLKPVVWQDNTAAFLQGYFSYTVWPVGLNEAGQIIGGGSYYRASPYANRRIAVRWDDGVLTPLIHPWGLDFFIKGLGIAANGRALLDGYGYFHFADSSVAPGFAPPPPYNRIVPYDMNDNMEVVGELQLETEDAGTTYSGFVETGGYLYDLKCLVNFPSGWEKVKVTGVNNAGTIVGVAEKGGEVRLFLLTRNGATKVGEDLEANRVPEEYQLLQNYPNPFNPETVISYAVAGFGRQSSVVSLKVYDVLGREVAVLVNEVKPAGRYQVTWEAKGIASGVYFNQMKAGDVVFTRKLVLLR